MLCSGRIPDIIQRRSIQERMLLWDTCASACSPWLTVLQRDIAPASLDVVHTEPLVLGFGSGSDRSNVNVVVMCCVLGWAHFSLGGRTPRALSTSISPPRAILICLARSSRQHRASTSSIRPIATASPQRAMQLQWAMRLPYGNGDLRCSSISSRTTRESHTLQQTQYESS